MDVLQQKVDAFMELPRSERRAQYPHLTKAVKLKARKAVEARRGIVRREDGGVMVLSKEAYLKQLSRVSEKVAELPKRLERARARVAELKSKVVEHYGEEALKEMEVSLKELNQ